MGIDWGTVLVGFVAFQFGYYYRIWQVKRNKGRYIWKCAEKDCDFSVRSNNKAIVTNVSYSHRAEHLS